MAFRSSTQHLSSDTTELHACSISLSTLLLHGQKPILYIYTAPQGIDHKEGSSGGDLPKVWYAWPRYGGGHYSWCIVYGGRACDQEAIERTFQGSPGCASLAFGNQHADNNDVPNCKGCYCGEGK